MVHFYIAALLLFLATCTAPVKNHVALPEENALEQTPSTSSQPSKSADTSLTPPEKAQLPVSEWKNVRFYVLPKQELIQSSGYNLSTCVGTQCDSLPISPTIELANRRFRCSVLESDTLTVTSVQPDANEWIVTFASAKTKKTVYAKTHKQAIMEIVQFDELAIARKRWLNSTVFSKRGTILVLSDKKRTSIASQRVNLLDSLTVTDVSWGITPLPVKPLWLSVTNKSTGKEGFIPIRYSWTNTLSDQITAKLPWEEDLFEVDPRSIYDWDDYTWEVINNHRVILEMTPIQVELSWGAPLEIATNLTSPDTLHYTYPSHTLVFENGKLATINER